MMVRPLLRAAMRPRIVRNALKVALLVGAVLNLVNQGGRILDGNPVSWLQVVMNFFVPYCVSTYSAAKNEIEKRSVNEP
jgi:hypothetical protein